jgi:O-antigen/teichoic acid export membrane protein
MLHNSVTLILAKVFSLGLGFLAWLVAARLFDASDVGLASAAVAGMMLCVQFAMVGVGSSIINLFPSAQRDPSRLLDSAFSIVGLASLAASVVFLAFAATTLQELRVISTDPAFAAVFVLLGVFGAIGVLLDQVSTVGRRGDQALTRNIVAGVVTLALIAVLAGVGSPISPSFGILVAWSVGSIAAVALGWRQLGRDLVPYRYRPRLDGLLVRRLVRVGLPNYVLTLAERAPGPVLPIIVTELLSPADNAHWYAVWMVAWVVFIVPIQVGLSLFAEVSHRPQAVAEIVRHGIRSSLVFGIAGAIALTFGGELVLRFLGQGYAAAGMVPLRILIWAVVPMTFIQAYFSTCRATQRLREAIVTGVISGLAGITAAAVGGVLAGLSGMAAAWLISQCLTAVWALSRLRALGASLSATGPVSNPVRKEPDRPVEADLIG